MRYKKMQQRIVSYFSSLTTFLAGHIKANKTVASIFMV
jgi:hypothetical protein